VDLALLAQQELDWALVVERARAWRLAAAVELALQLLTTLFPVPAAEPACAALRLKPGRRWLVGRFTSPAQVLAGERLTQSSRRLLFQLVLVDRPADVAVLLARSVWPERQWLSGGA
jgi:hypothetical protein